MEWQGEGPVGSCPVMVRDNRHHSAYLFGAICPTRGVGAAIIMTGANTEAMNEHLAEISTQVAPGAHAVLLLDGAGWHQTADRLMVQDDLSLLPLPPYSPELNSMENVWEYLRANKLCNRVWKGYDAIVRAFEEARDFLVNDSEGRVANRDRRRRRRERKVEVPRAAKVRRYIPA
ncbi:MAG: transposase [Acetobacteraceae bacterium]